MVSLRTHRWAWLGVLLVGLLLYIAVLVTLVDTENPNFIPSMILLGSAVVPATFLTFASGRLSGWRVSAGLLALTAFLGGVIGTIVAGWLEYDTLRDLGTVPMLAVGFIEEGAKLIVPAALLLVLGSRPKALAGADSDKLHRRGSVADGLVIGVATGMGFAVLETMGYAFVTLIESRGNIGDVEQLLFLRGLLSPAGHVAWAGLTCAALWQLAGHRSTRNAIEFAATFVAVALLHAAWDGFGHLVGYLVIGAISVGWLLWRIRQARILTLRHPLPTGQPAG
jgi:RsiW-degrading membrane proteinase PrsW (M82 family)